MKKILVLIFLIIIAGCSFNLCAQNVDLTIAKDRLSTIRPDIDTLNGIADKLIKFRFDTLFFINRIGVNDYINTKNQNKMLIQLSKSLIDTMTTSLNSIEGNFNILHKSIDLNNGIIKNSLETNNIRLTELENKNSELVKTNIDLRLSVKYANDQIKAARWKAIGPKMIFGTVGIGLGIGIGALLVK